METLILAYQTKITILKEQKPSWIISWNILNQPLSQKDPLLVLAPTWHKNCCSSFHWKSSLLSSRDFTTFSLNSRLLIRNSTNSTKRPCFLPPAACFGLRVVLVLVLGRNKSALQRAPFTHVSVSGLNTSPYLQLDESSGCWVIICESNFIVDRDFLDKQPAR